MAKWYGLNPDIIDRWTMPSFIDRQEYMFIQNDADKPEEPHNPNGLKKGEVPYKGRGK